MRSINNPAIYFVGIVLALAIFSACTSLAKKEESQESEEIKAAIIDTMKMQFSVTDIDSMYLMFPDSNEKKLINDTDKAKLGETLALSVNDTLWNNSGIMVKMVAPDYTLISHYKGKSQDENSWLMIWKETSRAKFENKWYFLDGSKKDEIFRIMDSYK